MVAITLQNVATRTYNKRRTYTHVKTKHKPENIQEQVQTHSSSDNASTKHHLNIPSSLP